MTLQTEPLTLESGDRLERGEFHRRYLSRPDIKRAELVAGVVYVASPVRLKRHGRPHAIILGWLHDYCISRPEIELADNATVILDADTEVQPDALMFRPGSGRATVTTDDYLMGPPDLVVEVASSSAAYDLHDKKRAYERSGVTEYLVWTPDGPGVTWFRLRSGTYLELEPDSHGVFESVEFPGLRLDANALADGDSLRLREGLR